MQQILSLTETPITMWEFCSLAQISPTTYHFDLANGIIQKNCCPYIGIRPLFRYSNFVDLVCYFFAKWILPSKWDIDTRICISEDLIDIVMCEYERDKLCSKEYLTSLILSTENELKENIDVKYNYSFFVKRNIEFFFCMKFFDYWMILDNQFTNILKEELNGCANNFFYCSGEPS